MGPGLVQAAKAGRFDPAGFTEAMKAADARDFDQTLAAIGKHVDAYPMLLADVSDSDFRAEIEMFGNKTSRGAFIVNLVLCGCAAYRTQLFVYLKACGREELSTDESLGRRGCAGGGVIRTDRRYRASQARINRFFVLPDRRESTRSGSRR